MLPIIKDCGLQEPAQPATMCKFEDRSCKRDASHQVVGMAREAAAKAVSGEGSAEDAAWATEAMVVAVEATMVSVAMGRGAAVRELVGWAMVRAVVAREVAVYAMALTWAVVSALAAALTLAPDRDDGLHAQRLFQHQHHDPADSACAVCASSKEAAVVDQLRHNFQSAK